MPSVLRRQPFGSAMALRIPLVGTLARLVRDVSLRRVGRLPVGLLALLPVAILIDVLDAVDELLLGPVGMLASFVLEAGFLLGLTGRTGYALGFAALDLVPVVDVLPLATLTLLKTLLDEMRAPAPSGMPVPA